MQKQKGRKKLTNTSDIKMIRYGTYNKYVQYVQRKKRGVIKK